MLNSIIKFSLGNRLIILLLSAVILIGGVFTLLRTEVDIFPDLNAPTVAVMTEAPGMAAEEVEKMVTYPIETAVAGARGVESVRSSSTTGFSVVNIQFTGDTEPLVARQAVAECLVRVESQLPPMAETPVIGPQSSILGEILIVALSSDSLELTELRTIADRRLRPALQGVSGVSSVSVIGGVEEEYQISLDEGKMRNLGVTLGEVAEALQDVNANSAGGIVQGYGNEYVVKADVSTADVDEIGCTVIRADGGRIITLSDIARIGTAGKSPRVGVASYRGNPAVIMTVTKQPGVGTISITEKLLDVITEAKKSLPEELNISTDIFAQRDFIDRSISNLTSSLFEGAIMVVIVLFFFMMNVRATAVSLIALPMSIIITVLILHMLGITVNTMTLGGIAIAIGSLVDDAIVDVENVSRRLRANRELPAGERKSMVKVVFEASKEVRMPIFNSSLIIIAGFMPLFFLSGVEGRMLVPLGVAFIIALGASTIVALTVTPVVCSYLLGTKGSQAALTREPVTMRWLKRVYGHGLARALRHKWVLVGITGAMFVVAAIMAAGMGRGFLPPFNEGSFTINISALPGISLDESDRIGRLAEKLILEVPEIETVARKTGRAELDEHSLGTNVSEIEAPYTLGDRSRGEIADDLRNRLSVIPGVNIEIGQPISHRIDAMLSGSESPIVFKIYGDDFEQLNHIAKELKEVMTDTEGLRDVAIEQQMARPELSVTPRRRLMARYGVTPAMLNNALQVAMSGMVVSQVYIDGYPRDITLRYDIPQEDIVDRLSGVAVDTPGGKVTLGDVAEVRYTESQNTVNRENSRRRIIVSANIEGRDVTTAVEEIRRKADNIKLPEGYTIEDAGQSAKAKEASTRLVYASLLSLLTILGLLYFEFKNLRQSFIILVNIPLAMIGGIFILQLTGGNLDIPAIIGFIALLGISTRNGMLLMSRYNALTCGGLSVAEAVKKGSLDRLTPIVMTALTSALALIPLALRGGDPGNEIQSPLATVILGGLASSTFLNLFIVPVLYMIYKRRNGSECDAKTDGIDQEESVTDEK
ncbi:MAG: CusA/CzcA family heavy metal efflux RND transporter [Muribaculaceae bacterium]|nr:CusA/CzcA family heavy metal efflux RND transporter [Muribaculaceae bacterium]